MDAPHRLTTDVYILYVTLKAFGGKPISEEDAARVQQVMRVLEATLRLHGAKYWEFYQSCAVAMFIDVSNTGQTHVTMHWCGTSKHAPEFEYVTAKISLCLAYELNARVSHRFVHYEKD